MRFVETRPPSFPQAPVDVLLQPIPGERWQVLCGDAGHWRVGIYSPPEACIADCGELERHDCPELFLLLSGHVTLVLSDGTCGVRELPLQTGQPVLVETPHTAYCPDGPHSGTCFVVERDAFDTEYRRPADWGQ
jgi:hypothetical protein